MDFDFTADQSDLRGLARRILTDVCTPEHLKAVAATESGLDLDLWRALAGAGLVGIEMAESGGGGGLGFIESCIVLEECARVAAPVPALAVIGLAVGSLAGHADLLAGVADGTMIVTAALHEDVGDPRSPSSTVTDGRLAGVKVCVPAGLVAERFVVSAADGLYVVESRAEGVSIERQDTTTGVPEARVVFSGAPAVRVGDVDALRALIERASTAASVMVAGHCAAAVAMTSEYVKSRQQFDRPIASFQAVSQRTADAYIDAEGVRLTAWQAAWRIDEGRPASEQVLTAKYWAAEGGQRVVHAAQHLHGGFGVDREYPLHRHFLTVKQLELFLGSATPSLARLGRLLAG